jgi:outer membrane protein assembly factor BamB
VYSSPAVANGVVYGASYNSRAWALDARSGDELWSYDTGPGGYVDSSPAVVNGVVYLGSCNGIYAFSLKHGTN